jgi:hypothetical protein
VHHADIAEILDELDFEEATYIFKVLDSDKKRQKFFLNWRMICARIY